MSEKRLMWLVAFLWAVTCVCGCEQELDGPMPAISSELDPHLVCNQLEPLTRLTISGSGLSPMPVDTATGPARLELPVVELLRSSDLAGSTVSDVAVIVPDESPETSQVHWISQSQMDIDITPGLGLDEGIYGVTLTNPNGNETSLAAVLAVVPPPTIESVTPDTICLDQGSVTLTFVGNGFLDVDGTLPTVTISTAEQEWTYEPDGLGECAQLPAPATETQTCSELSLTIPQGDLPVGTYQVVVTNPPPANCSSSETIVVEVVPPPELLSVAPSLLCTGGGSIGLQGSGFRPGASVEVGGLETDQVDVAEGGESATALFGPGLSEGNYDVTFTNADGCSDTLEGAADVIQGPVIFWIDPPVVYNGISTQITIFGSGLSSEVYMVELVPEGDGEPIELLFTLDEARGRIQAVVESGTAPGNYDVVVYDDVCPAVLPGGLVVTDSLELTITAVEPSFGWTERDTSVAIFGTGFVTTPRAYLNPENPSEDTVATTLSAVAFVDPTRLTAVVTSGIPVGTYDLIVVNPTGEVGLLEGAFSVTSNPPPTIDSVSPGAVDNSSVHDIDIRGSGFEDPTASWICRERDGDADTPAGTVTDWTEDAVTVTLDAEDLSAGTVCVLRVTNADGAYGEFSAVAVTNPASNIEPFIDGTSMTTGRRGLGLVAGRATRSARFLYALGGDNGAEAGAMDTDESASVDIFGYLGDWFDQPYGLPGATTLTTARTIGRFIYLVGGHDGVSAIDDVWRTQILDPLDSPTIEDIMVVAGDGAGLGSGIWYYCVSAVFPSDHPTNPGGESLPSDPLVLNLPDNLLDTLIITLIWSSVDGASAFRIYRSPDPDMASGSERLLVEVPADPPLEFVDDNSLELGTEAPLPLGAHGTWVELPPLNTPRAGHGLGYALDPDDPNQHYLYAVGGIDEGGNAMATFEFLPITVVSDRDQTVAGSWTDGLEFISLARHQLGVYSVDHVAAPRVPDGTTYLYAVAGLDNDGVDVSDAEVAIVTAGGQLGAFEEIDSARNRAGFAHVAANNFLYLISGGPAATSSAYGAEICDGVDLSCTGGPPDPPDIQNWNNEGSANLDPPRYLPGSTLESAFIFVVGGVDNVGAVLSSTAQTVW